MRIDRIELSEWRDIMPRRGVEPFHLPETLSVINQYCPGELQLLGGFKGQEPVGLLPVHERTKLGGRILTSPPLGLGIRRLGPVVMPSSPKQRKQERTNRKFIRAVMEHLETGSARTLIRFACSPRYSDPRPFQWDNFTVRPAFTYRLPLTNTDSETLLKSFSSGLRREIRKQDEVDFSIQRGDMSAVKRTYESVEKRYQNQNQGLPLSWNFVRDLFEILDPDDHARVYSAQSDDGEFFAGMIVLYSGDTAYFWKGGAKAGGTVSPNSLLHWQIITDILTDPSLADIEAYDLYTANNERLAKYKSKFGGVPEPYYIVESNGAAMKAAKGLYRLSAFGRNPLRAEE